MGYMRKDGESTKTDAVIPGPKKVVNVVSTSLANRHSTRRPSSGNEPV